MNRAVDSLAGGSRKASGASWSMGVLLACLCCSLMGHVASAETPQGTAFTYQGRLSSAGAPTTGTYDLQFILYDALTAGIPVGTVVTLGGVVVTGGLFTVTLDFGATAFSGSKRWLEVGVKLAGSGGGFTPLTPRQELTAAPGALWSSKAGDAQTLSGIASSGFMLAGSVVPINQGGTGAMNATDARANLQSARSGANLDITSLSGLTTPLGVSQGGTGASTAAAARASLNAQARLAAVCPPGEFLRGVNVDGSVVCEASTPAITSVVDRIIGIAGSSVESVLESSLTPRPAGATTRRVLVLHAVLRASGAEALPILGVFPAFIDQNPVAGAYPVTVWDPASGSVFTGSGLEVLHVYIVSYFSP